MSYRIEVKWSNGQVNTVGGFTVESLDRWVDFLWTAGADDVRVWCECGECEACTDRAAFYGAL